MIISAPHNKIFTTTTITTCLFASLGLFTELYLSNHGESLCHTSSCEIVAKFVRFGEPSLLAAGAIFFLLLAGTIYFGSRYADRAVVSTAPLLLLAGATAFDGALIGFQFITLGQKCPICITVAITLFIVAFFYAMSLKKWSVFFLCLTIWLAGFMANSLLIMPDETTTSAEMVFYERKASAKIETAPTATLIFSMTCPHCKEILEHLSQKNPADMTWRFAVVDRDKAIVNKLGYFFDNAAHSNNLFKLLLESKDKNSVALAPDILPKVLSLTRQARIFLSNNGINGIPVLVVDSTPATKTILTGTVPILEYLDN